MTSRAAIRLLDELARAEGLPPYDTKGVLEVREEIKHIASDLEEGFQAVIRAATARLSGRGSGKGATDAGGDDDDFDDGGGGGGGGGGDDGDGGDGGGADEHIELRVMSATVARDKRCLLAYVMHRADRVELLRWNGGPVLAPEARAKLSSEEVDLFKSYCGLLLDYMEAERADALLTDFRPPKSDTVIVRALVDCGEVAVSKGGARRINVGEVCTLARADAEPLIRRGMMQEVPRGN